MTPEHAKVVLEACRKNVMDGCVEPMPFSATEYIEAAELLMTPELRAAMDRVDAQIAAKKKTYN